MNNNSAVQVYVIPEYPDVIFHGMSHLRSARCVLHAPHTVLSRPLFIHFHLPLCFFYYYPYYSFSPPSFILLLLPLFPRLPVSVVIIIWSPRTTMSPHNWGQSEHAKAFVTFRHHVWTTHWWMIRLLGRHRSSNICCSSHNSGVLKTQGHDPSREPCDWSQTLSLPT